MVVAHDPEGASRRAQKRNKSIKELEDLALKWSGKLDAQDTDARKGKGRPMSDSGAKARFYHAVKDASLAHIIKVDLKGDLFSYGGCTEFCVNGLMAGNRRTSRSGYDRKYKESSTQRSD